MRFGVCVATQAASSGLLKAARGCLDFPHTWPRWHAVSIADVSNPKFELKARSFVSAGQLTRLQKLPSQISIQSCGLEKALKRPGTAAPPIMVATAQVARRCLLPRGWRGELAARRAFSQRRVLNRHVTSVARSDAAGWAPARLLAG